MNSLVINTSLWQGHLTLTGTLCSSPAKRQKREETVPVRAFHPGAFLYWDSPALIANFHMHLQLPSAFLPCRSWWWLGVNHFIQDNICPLWQEKCTLRVGKVIPEGFQVYVQPSHFHPRFSFLQRNADCPIAQVGAEDPQLCCATGKWPLGEIVLEQWQELPVIWPPSVPLIVSSTNATWNSGPAAELCCWPLLRVFCCSGQEHFPFDDR